MSKGSKSEIKLLPPRGVPLIPALLRMARATGRAASTIAQPWGIAR
jgi:hypothetical protein